MKREMLSLALNGLDEKYITEAAAFCPNALRDDRERSLKSKPKRIISIALAAALILALGITAYAIVEGRRCTGTNAMPKTGNYSSLSDISKIEKDVGYPVTAPESFSNGYSFNRLRVDGEAVYGENYEVLEEYYAVRIIYSKPDASDLTLALSPVMELPGGVKTPEASEAHLIDGVTVSLSLDHYKTVPESYEKTEEDLAMEAEGHYYISFGSEEISECDYAFASFDLNGVSYVLMDMSASEDSLDSLTQMAEELITAIND